MNTTLKFIVKKNCTTTVDWYKNTTVTRHRLLRHMRNAEAFTLLLVTQTHFKSQTHKSIITPLVECGKKHLFTHTISIFFYFVLFSVCLMWRKVNILACCHCCRSVKNDHFIICLSINVSHAIIMPFIFKSADPPQNCLYSQRMTRFGFRNRVGKS
jgi:hypothetical protein